MAEKKKKNQTPIEANLILRGLESRILRDFVSLKNSKFYPSMKEFCERYAKTKKGEVLDYPTDDERKLANYVSFKKGNVWSLSILIEVVEGSGKELAKRKED